MACRTHTSQPFHRRAASTISCLSIHYRRERVHREYIPHRQKVVLHRKLTSVSFLQMSTNEEPAVMFKLPALIKDNVILFSLFSTAFPGFSENQ